MARTPRTQAPKVRFTTQQEAQLRHWFGLLLADAVSEIGGWILHYQKRRKRATSLGRCWQTQCQRLQNQTHNTFRFAWYCLLFLVLGDSFGINYFDWHKN